MLKKVKHASGKREIFLFGKKILSYTRRKIKLNQLENELNQFARKYNNLVANQMILQRSDESVILALRQCLMPVPKAKNPQNIVRYLNLVRPFVSPNLKLVRVGGVGDGGYAMACLPEFNAVTPFNATMPNATPPPPFNAA